MDRKAWLRERQTGLGGTDVAAICGVGFGDAARVYAEKAAAEPSDDPPSGLMLLGLATERANADLYRARFPDRTVVEAGLLRSPVEPWMFATFDRVRDDDRPVELKYAGPFFGDRWGEDGTDQIPEGYIVQAIWQVIVARHNRQPDDPPVDAADVSALNGVGEHRVYTVPYDDRLALYLLELGAAFWARVVKREPVGDDWQHPLREAVGNRLAQIRPDTGVQLGPDAHALAEWYQQHKAEARDAERRANGYKAKLLDLLGGHETGVFPDGTRIRQKVVRRKAYTVEASQYVDFRVIPPKKGERQGER